MGIKGLLPFLKDIQQNSDIKKYKGQTVGVDTYCWLHRGSYSCAKQLVLGEPTDKHIKFVMKRVQMLLDNGITPIMVFDGGQLPAKTETNQKRSEMKMENKQIAIKCLEKGDNKRAYEYFQRCVHITAEMASSVIQECKLLNVSCVVAPYEADAQLAYLYRTKIITLVISEDSDLLAFGCERVFFKMDGEGKGMVVDMAKLPKLKLFPKASPSVERELFRHLCILSGCDYLSNLRGIGLKTALNLLRNNYNIFEVIEKLRREKGEQVVPLSYEEEFNFANSMFLNQLVFDITSCSLVELTSLKNHETLSCGEFVFDKRQIIEIALGNLNPTTNRILAANTPDDFPVFRRLASKENLYIEPNTTKGGEIPNDVTTKENNFTEVHAKKRKIPDSDKHALKKSKYFNKKEIISATTALKTCGNANGRAESTEMLPHHNVPNNKNPNLHDNNLTPPLNSQNYSGAFSWSVKTIPGQVRANNGPKQ